MHDVSFPDLQQQDADAPLPATESVTRFVIPETDKTQINVRILYQTFCFM